MIAADLVIILALLVVALAFTCVGLWWQAKRAREERDDAWITINALAQQIHVLKRCIRAQDRAEVSAEVNAILHAVESGGEA